MSHDLKQKLFDVTNGRVKSEEEFLREIKKLVVKARNQIVRLVKFMRLAQKSDKDIKSWCSRVTGMPGQCDFRVHCSCQVWVS